MRAFVFLFILTLCSTLSAQDIGRAEPPYVEATVTMPTRLMQNAEKRCTMVEDLADKSQMNYRLLGMKIMEQWQASIKKDKAFLHEMMKHDKLSFTVKKDGSIVIEGVEPPAGKDSKGGGKKGRTKDKATQ